MPPLGPCYIVIEFHFAFARPPPSILHMSVKEASPPSGGRHWIRLRYVGAGEAPNRNDVGVQLLQSEWIAAADIYSFIALPNKKDYELIFHQERAMQRFCQVFSAATDGFWKSWEMDSSAPQDVRTVYVKFWTGRIADADVEQYLLRFCDLLQPVYKPVDQFGIWYGVRRYRVKLRKSSDGSLMQIPNTISMGPYNGRITYQGQMQRCYVCGSLDHQLKECEAIKCWKCGDLGHKGKDCNNVEVCSLCGQKGHSYFRCPKSYSYKARATKPQNMPQKPAAEPIDNSSGVKANMIQKQSGPQAEDSKKNGQRGAPSGEQPSEGETSSGEDSSEDSSASTNSSSNSSSSSMDEESTEVPSPTNGTTATVPSKDDQQQKALDTGNMALDIINEEIEKRKWNSSAETEGLEVKGKTRKKVKKLTIKDASS